MKIAAHDIGVCSWSIHPKDTPDLIASVKKLGLQHVQLGMMALAMMDEGKRREEIALLKGSGLTFTAGMIGFKDEDYSTIAAIRKTGGYVNEQNFPTRREITKKAAQVGLELGMKMLTAHIGFVPPSSNPEYAKMVTRVGEIAGDLHALGVTLLMETGQESAPELLQFLNDLSRPNVKVNFDPANMILYGAGEPIEAINVLGRHIGHVHVKDATSSDKPGVTHGGRKFRLGPAKCRRRIFCGH